MKIKTFEEWFAETRGDLLLCSEDNITASESDFFRWEKEAWEARQPEVDLQRKGLVEALQMREKHGISSRTMLCAFFDIDNTATNFGNDIPYDVADFVRCFNLLERNPEFRSMLYKLNQFEKWKPFIANWDKLEALYLLSSGNMDGLYAFIKELRGEK